MTAVRGGAVHDTFAFLDKFEQGARAKVLARTPEVSRELLLNASRTSWVPVEHDHFLVDGIVEVLGVARAVQYWRAATTHLIERPILKSFVSGMINLFGDDPGRVIGLLPKGWPLVYRDVAELSYTRPEQGMGTVLFDHVALPVRLYPNYFHSWHGTCLGVADLARAGGGVEFSVARDRSSAVARFRWS
jgi:hypothetical protein